MGMRTVTHLIFIPRQRGLSLIEVMVGMTIGLLLLVALGSMMFGSTRSFKVQDNFSRMQDNGAYAMNTLGRSIRMSGFYGYSNTGGLQDSKLAGALDDSANGCGANWIVNSTGNIGDRIQPLFGYMGLTSGNVTAAVPCINAANFVSGSPILITRSANGILTAEANLDEGALYIQSDIEKSNIFSGSDYVSAGFTGKGGYATKLQVLSAPGVTTAAPIYGYEAAMYYLRPCSRPSNAGLCSATDDGGRPIPTLVRRITGNVVANAPTMTEEAVAEGVERMNIQYGIDTSIPGDGVPEQYVTVPTALQWPQVVTVRLALLVRSPELQRDYNDGGKVYDLGGGVSFSCAGNDCHYHRHVFTQTFQIRNLAQQAMRRS